MTTTPRAAQVVATIRVSVHFYLMVHRVVAAGDLYAFDGFTVKVIQSLLSHPYS